MTAALTLAFAAGTVATVNPCGFALLPAYLARRIAAADRGRSRPVALARAATVGAATTAGFVAVFAVVGSAIALGARFLTTLLPWFGLAIGITLAAAGLAVLTGRHVSLRLPRLDARYRDGLRGDVSFGVGYAVASLSCALPLFLAALGSSLTGGLGGSILAFGAYAAGMGAVLTALAVMAALARDGLTRLLRRLLPYVELASGALLTLAGAYVIYYWAFTIRGGPRAPIDHAAAISSRLGGWLAASPTQHAAAALAAALAVASLIVGLATFAKRLRPLLRPRWAVAVLVLPLALAGTAYALGARTGGSQRLDRSQLRGFLEPAVAAPQFRLDGTSGGAVRLADLRGRPVVIAFVYSHCRDICPLTAVRIRAAQRLLGPDSGKVTWLALSVDPRTDTPASVRAFSRHYGLLGRWRYLFRPWRRVLATLKAYGVQPQLTDKPAVVEPYQQHSSYVGLLDARGHRVEGFTGQTLTGADLAHDLRLLLRSSGLITGGTNQGSPSTRQSTVPDSSRPAVRRPSASMGNGRLRLSGSDLGSGRPLSLDGYRNTPVVVNVWASWCAGCAAEAPALAAFARAHPEAQVVGIDVEDTPAAGRAFIERFALPYPSIFDPSGATAIPLQVSGLPSTLFLDRSHRIVARIVGETDRAGFERGLRSAERRSGS